VFKLNVYVFDNRSAMGFSNFEYSMLAAREEEDTSCGSVK
jgi:hypothetical protein